MLGTSVSVCMLLMPITYLLTLFEHHRGMFSTKLGIFSPNVLINDTSIRCMNQK